MNVAPTSTAAAAQASATATTPSTSGALTGSKDEFLKLFMAQLEHQDPLSPQDGAGMVAQLAQFSSVEQATQTNQHLVDLAASQASSASASLSSLVGRDCNAAAADFQLDRGGAAPALQVSSTSAMNGASLVITDDGGKEIRRIPIPAGATSTQIHWDGNTATGAPAVPGSYHVTVDAGTTAGAITAQWRGRVDAIELADGTTRLRMGGVLLAPSAVQTIGQTTGQSTGSTTGPSTTP
jgi:flagellar basal-body rod modification protein FlgD